MNINEKQEICKVLNNLKVIERQGGDDGYMLVANNEENRALLESAGVNMNQLDGYCEEEDGTLCILSLAFGEKYADEYRDGHFVVWDKIDDDLRYRVLNGEGTPSDAERLLKALEPNLVEDAPQS